MLEAAVNTAPSTSGLTTRLHRQASTRSEVQLREQRQLVDTAQLLASGSDPSASCPTRARSADIPAPCILFGHLSGHARIVREDRQRVTGFDYARDRLQGIESSADNRSMAGNETPRQRGLLYRIMDFHRVVQIFEGEALYFAHPSTWDDPYEKFIKHPQSHALFAQCWTRAYSSDAMWRIYSPHGLGVRISTTEDLLNAFGREFGERPASPP